MAVLISKMVTTMLRHFYQEKRQTDDSRYWDSINTVLVRKFADEGARDFHKEAWLQMICEGRTKRRIEYCKNEDGTLHCVNSISPIQQNSMENGYDENNGYGKER